MIKDLERSVPEKKVKESSSGWEIREFRALQKSEKCTPRKRKWIWMFGCSQCLFDAYLFLARKSLLIQSNVGGNKFYQ